jgi:outer membrane protein assembly factor BamA
LDSWYADLTVSHEISKAASYGFSAGHEIIPGIQSDAVEDWYFRPSINWMIVKDVNLSTSLFYEHGNQGVGNVSGNLMETFDWYGGGLTASYPLMKTLHLSVNYRLTLRSSNLASQEYAQNIVGLRLTYQP